MYGSVTLLPLTSILTVLPLPNVPFFWILFRAYSHWKALKGSERLLLLVSDCSGTWSSITNNEKGNDSKDESDHGAKAAPMSPWVLKPSEDLEKLLVEWKPDNGVRRCTISAICEAYGLDKNHVLKFRDSL